MSWQAYVVLHLILTTAFAVYYRKYAKTDGRYAAANTALMYVYTILPIGIIWGFLRGDVDFTFDPVVWLSLFAGGLLFALANIFAFKANSLIDAAQFSIIGSLRTVATITVSSFFLSEILSPLQLTGVLLILVASLGIALLKFNQNTFHLTSGSALAVLSAVLMGVAISNEKFILDHTTLSTYMIVGWGLQTAFMVIFALPTIKKSWKVLNKPKVTKSLITLGLLRTFAGFALISALVLSDNSSLIAALVSYKTVLVTVAAYLILKEGDNLRMKLIGALTATAGILLLILG